VGTPHLHYNFDDRPDLAGAARPTPGLAALDQEREASMADEGGASGAVMEAEDPSVIPLPARAVERNAPAVGSHWRPFFLAGLFAGVGLGIWTYRRR
jgi:hypothetical protein